MAALDAAFSAMDVNHDGVITREEFLAAQRRAVGVGSAAGRSRPPLAPGVAWFHSQSLEGRVTYDDVYSNKYSEC